MSTRHTWEGDTYQHCDGVEGVGHLSPRCDGPYSGCRSGSGPRAPMSSRPVGVRVSPDNAMKAWIPQLVVASWSTSWEAAGVLACDSSVASTSEN